MGKQQNGQKARISSKLVQNERGAVLLMALMASVVIVLTALYSNRNYLMENRVEKILNAPAALSILRQKIKATLMNPDAWNNTVAKSTNITLKNCRQNYPISGASACPMGENPLTLVNESDETYVSVEGGLFDAIGNPCTDTLLSPCPVRVEATWKATCPSPAAPCPVIEINVRFVKANYVSSGMNASTYNIRVELL